MMFMSSPCPEDWQMPRAQEISTERKNEKQMNVS
jgi:hypothetical protein